MPMGRCSRTASTCRRRSAGADRQAPRRRRRGRRRLRRAAQGRPVRRSGPASAPPVRRPWCASWRSAPAPRSSARPAPRASCRRTTRIYVGVTGLGGHDSVTDYMAAAAAAAGCWCSAPGSARRPRSGTSDLVPRGGLHPRRRRPRRPRHRLPRQPDDRRPGRDRPLPDSAARALPGPAGAAASRAPARRRDEPVPLPARRPRAGPAAGPDERHPAPRRRGDRRGGARRVRQLLRLVQPLPALRRRRAATGCSTLFGSMGHAAAGVVGAALARRGKAVAVVGDGSMLMNSELSTAAQYRAPAVWIVLNDAGYGMCRDGHRALGLTDAERRLPAGRLRRPGARRRRRRRHGRDRGPARRRHATRRWRPRARSSSTSGSTPARPRRC